MTLHLPSLKSLRAFEVAARHLSFHQAAEELNVTPAAITHQIKNLEADLGVALFRRQSRGVVLTAQGRACLPDIQAAFELLCGAVKDLRSSAEVGEVDATIPPGFAAMWLVPRLHRFRERYPDIAVRFVTRPEPIDLKTLQTDLAIRFGHGSYPGYRVDPIMKETITPICSPKLVKKGPHRLRRPEDLRHHTLLHVAYPSSELAAARWAAWLEIAGLDDIDVTQGLFFDNIQHAVQAAMNGAGVFLGFRALTADEIARGHLVCPFDLNVPETLGYFLVCPRDIANLPRIAVFRDWLIGEAKAAADLHGVSGQAAWP